MGGQRGKVKAKARKKKRLEASKRSAGYRKRFLNKILKWDEPILSEQCSIVEKGEDISNLIRDMGRILSFSENGVGLAASQIGVVKRVVAAKINKEVRFFINPEIKIHSGNTIKSMEACLSYPGIEVVVDRNDTITVDYEDEARIHHIKEFKDFSAIILQHEIDHTNGICGVGAEWKRLNTPPPVEESTEQEEYDDPVSVESDSSKE